MFIAKFLFVIKYMISVAFYGCGCVLFCSTINLLIKFNVFSDFPYMKKMTRKQ